MPRKRQYRKKRTTTRRPKTVVKYVPKTLGPLFPPTMTARHKFGKTITLLQADNGVAADENIDSSNSAAFRCNNIYDPDYATASGADKAIFYQEMAAHYKRYKVLGAKLTCKFINLCEDQCYIGIIRDLSHLSSGDVDGLIERQGTKHLILNPASSGPGGVKIIRSGYSPAKQFNVSKKQVKAMNELTVDIAGTGADSDFNALWNIWMAPVAHGHRNADTIVECQVNIEYLVRWEDRQILPDPSV